MCQFALIRLSAEEKKEVRKLSGIMIPIYVSVAFVLFAVVTLAHFPHTSDGTVVAKNSPPATESAPAQATH